MDFWSIAGNIVASIIVGVAVFAPAVAKLKPVAETPPASFSDETRAQLWHAYAAGERRLGDERGDNARLATAIAFYKEALSVWTREKAPLDWALAQNNLGAALSMLGERQAAADKAKGCAILESARDHYVSALEEFQKAGASYYVERAQNNIAQLDAIIARLCG